MTRSAAKAQTTPTKSASVAEPKDDPSARSPKRRKLSTPEATEETFVKGEPQAAANAALDNAIQQQQPPSKGSSPAVTASDVVANARAGHLAALDKSASQLLSTLADMTSFKINKMLFGTPTAKTHEYKSLKSQFEQTRRILARDSPFLSAKTLGISDETQVARIRTANMATFAVSAFSGELGLRMLDVMFLDVFVPDNEGLKKLPGTIWLELKTQAFIAARRTGTVSPYQAMLDLFPPNTEKMLIAKHPASTTLTENERYFMEQFNSRRETLYADTKSNNLDRLHERHTWDDFSTALNDYLCVYYGSLDLNDFKAVAARAYEIAKEGVTDPYSFTGSSQGPSQQAATPVQSSTRMRPVTSSTTPVNPSGNSAQQTSSPKPQSGIQADTSNVASENQSNQADSLPSSQTVPTKELHTRLRATGVHLDASSAENGKAVDKGRPWTQDEDNALLLGIDAVKGPQWSQILNLYGPGGSISEVLRERTQDQLKDKARNLSLAFIKAKVEVPYYLHIAAKTLANQ